MYLQRFITLLFSLMLCLSIHAQTKSNTGNTKKNKPVTDNADTTSKGMKVTNVKVKDAGSGKQQAQPAQAQAPEKKSISVTTAAVRSPFQAGTLRLSNQSMGNFYSYKRAGYSPGKDNDLDGSLNLTWFPINGLGIGVDARYNDSYYTTQGTTSDYNYWAAYFHLVYGYAFNNRYHAFVKLGYGPAKSDSKSYLGLDNNHLVSSFRDMYVAAGGPIRVEKEGTLFITPLISYDQYKGTAGTHDIRSKTTLFSIRLESYLPLSGGEKTSKKYYEKGAQFVDYSSRFEWNATTRSENQGEIHFVPRKFNNRFLRAGYGLYLLDNVAAGLNLELSHNREKNTGSLDDVSNTISVQPTIMAQVPVEGALNHLFAQVSYEISAGKESGQVKTKEATVDFRVGYNLFIAKNLALTPRVGYTIDKNTRKYVSGDVKSTSKGLAGELMLRAWLDWKWLK